MCASLVAEGIISEDIESYEELRFLGDEGTDSARLHASLTMHSDDPRQQWVWFDLAFAQTRRILSNPAVWRTVELLAEQLLRERTIDRGAAGDTIRASLGRSKWERELFEMGERYASPPATWIESREVYRQMEKAMSVYAQGGASK